MAMENTLGDLVPFRAATCDVTAPSKAKKRNTSSCPKPREPKADRQTDVERCSLLTTTVSRSQTTPMTSNRVGYVFLRSVIGSKRFARDRKNSMQPSPRVESAAMVTGTGFDIRKPGFSTVGVPTLLPVHHSPHPVSPFCSPRQPSLGRGAEPSHTLLLHVAEKVARTGCGEKLRALTTT